MSRSPRARWLTAATLTLIALAIAGATPAAAAPRARHAGGHASATTARTAGTSAAVPAGATWPSVRLIAPTAEMDITRFPGQPIYVDPGTYLAAVGGAWQVDASRPDYDHPVAARQVMPATAGSPQAARQLPDGLVTALDGMDRFFRVVVRDSLGEIVTVQKMAFCPSGNDQRVDDSGPQQPTYPRNCFAGPFSLGAVFGIDQGWAVSALGYNGILFDGKNGDYTVRISITQAYRDFFAIPYEDGFATVLLHVSKEGSSCGDFCPDTSGHRRKSSSAAGGSGLTPAATLAGTPAANTLPDLVALPAWSIDVTNIDSHDYLEFAATVWNRGPSPLVVEGFRQEGKPRMRAWQYFYGPDGQVVSRARVGGFHYDRRPGHEHWHIDQFARYSLLDENQQQTVLSEKQAFCLAPTDAIDMTVKRAEWNPGSIGLSTACGWEGSIWVREVLPSGWGDTYVQTLPGQSFDITSLPNGKYYIAVDANPDGVLYERNMTNNRELREVKLSGTPGHRSVLVTPWHGITI